jgi:hypothetical protein
MFFSCMFRLSSLFNILVVCFTFACSLHILVNLPHTLTLRASTTQETEDNLTRVAGLRDRSRASPFVGSPGGSTEFPLRLSEHTAF